MYSITTYKSAYQETPSAVLKELIQRHTTCDPWKNNTIDVTSIAEANSKGSKEVFKAFIEEYLTKDSHHLLVKLAKEQTRVFKWLNEEADFNIYSAEKNTIVLKRCLHKNPECKYPAYKTLSEGITVVLLSKDLTHLLLIEENSGPYRGLKCPTGSVESDIEDPDTAAVRELLEETNVSISKDQLHLVGTISTLAFRGRNADINFIFAATCDMAAVELKAQEDEIKTVCWLPVSEFLSSSLPVQHQLQPLVIKQVVEIALNALKKGTEGNSKVGYWSSGKQATLYSVI